MRCVILTGMSGAGKSTVIKFLEDIGYFCVDNLPPSLIPKFIELWSKTGTDHIDNIAFGIDIRGGKLFDDLSSAVSHIKTLDCDVNILFLDASNDVLLKRFKESRRKHPLVKDGRLMSGIELERNILYDIKSNSDYIIDTSYTLSRQLKEKINEIFVDNKEFDSLMVTILSFGFKYGIPSDADLVFDVRFVPNPFYIAELKYLTGNDKQVRDYVMQSDESKEFLKKLNDMISFLIPNYIKEGKNQLVIAIGCTGGKHRSVTYANKLYSLLHKEGFNLVINHRDIDKDLKLQ